MYGQLDLKVISKGCEETKRTSNIDEFWSKELDYKN
jgi:hypothetical protein